MRWEIQDLGRRLATAANVDERLQKGSSKAQDKAQHAIELQRIIQAIRKLLTRIEDAVPLINLAITASGASLSSSLPSTVSPSRLLQASTFLTAGDSQYSASVSSSIQIGPTFSLSMYMLFAGHIRPQNEEDIRHSTWKEVIHKADVRLMRVPINALNRMPGLGQQPLDREPKKESLDCFPDQMLPEVRADEYAYQLVIVEDLEDDRVHTFEEDEPQPGPYGDIPLAGIREAVPIHELSKIFYADTGKILNIGNEGEANSPVLLLKRDLNAIPPRRMMNRYDEQDDQNENPIQGLGTSGSPSPSVDDSKALVASSNGDHYAPDDSHQQLVTTLQDYWRLPPDLDPEWIAFEVYTETEDSDAESEAETSSAKPTQPSRSSSVGPAMASAMSRLSMTTPVNSPSPQPATPSQQPPMQPSLPPIRTSLSLLEMLLRLLSLQQFQQTPHLSIPDELLIFFLSESASTGAASNNIEERKRLREEARRTVGFDPYDESPVKRRGEEYQYRGGAESERWDGEEQSFSRNSTESNYADEGYDTRSWTYQQQGRLPSTPRQSTPETPPMLLKNRSKSAAPSSAPSNLGGRPPPLARSNGSRRYGLRGADGAERKGSPLARPSTSLTDEGLGTSPASISGEKR